MSHGAPSEVDPAAFLGDDPALALVTADLVAWLLAHPCECEALCTCDDEDVSEARRLTADHRPRRYTITYTLRRFRFYPATWPLGMRTWTWEKVCTSDEAYGMLGQLDGLGLDGARITSERLDGCT